MTESEIQRIERSLGSTIPGFYRDFLFAYSEELQRLHQILRVRFRAVIHWDADEIITDNQFARRAAADVFTMGENGEPWPQNNFIVGNNGGGDYWFVHRDGSDTKLWLFSSETYDVEEWAPSLELYLDDLRGEAESVAGS